MLLSEKRIFIVEDEAGNLAVASVYLRQQGATVGFERWGRTTTSMLEKFLPVDCILLDLMFPNGVTGYDVFKEIRAVEELRHIPVIAVSASDPDTAMPRCLQLGFKGFIAKPIFPSISRHVADVIAGKNVWIADSSMTLR